jgi:Family of unknown function (DUF5317)/Major Facilitator Superfamily
MFLLPSLVVGFTFALLLGGRITRVLEMRYRQGWTVLASLALQIVIFSGVGAHLGGETRAALHLTSYALLIVFAYANVRTRLLLPVTAGLLLNAIAITANGGRMPLSHAAMVAAGIVPAGSANVSVQAHHLSFLGDVFALPPQLPLANVFSVGDLLIAAGMIGYIVAVATRDGSEPMLRTARLFAPLRLPTYRRLVGGRLVSQMGDWLTITALVGWIYTTTRSTTAVAATLLVRLAPPILGGGVAAMIVDRLPKRRLLVGVDLVRAAVTVLAIGGVLLGSKAIVFVALALSGALASVAATALAAVLPSLLEHDNLPSANAGLGIAKDVSMAIGAAGGGLALTRIGITWTLGVDVATFVGAVACFLGLRGLAFEPAARSPRRALAGFRYLIAHKRLLLLVSAFATATVATGLTNASLPRFLGHSIGLGPGAYGYGFAALAGGLALGEASVGFTRPGETAGKWIGGGLLMLSGLFVMLALTTHAPTALLLLATIGFIDGTTDVLFQTAVQRRADPQHYGCVFGFSSAFMVSTMMSAFAVAPVANSVVGSRGAVVVAAAILVVAGALGLAAVAPARAERLAPEAA